MNRRGYLNPFSKKRAAEFEANGWSTGSTFSPEQRKTSLKTGWFNRTPKTADATDAKDRKLAARLRATYTGPKPKVCRSVDDRADGRCEFPQCYARADDRHHRLNRKAGGRHGEMRDLLNGTAWLLDVCRPHHNLVTNAVGEVLAELKRIGWVLMEGQDARQVPVLTSHSERMVLLDSDGDWQVAKEAAA